MSRGKAAAQNARRRTDEALAVIEQLQSRLREQEDRHRREVNVMRNERDVALSRLTREVEMLSRAAVNDAQQAAALAVTDAKRSACNRTRETLRLLSSFIPDEGFENPEEAWAELSRASGLEQAEIALALNFKLVTNRRLQRLDRSSRAGHAPKVVMERYELSR